jgi:hypothetical protein
MNWQTLYDHLPDGADHARFRASVEEAVRIYMWDSDDAELWERINTLLHGKGVEKLFEEVEKLKRQPFKSLAAKTLLSVRHLASFQEQFEQSRAQQRRERLYSNLLRACEVGGLNLSNSDEGPLVKVFKLLAGQIVPEAGRQKKRVDDAGLSGSGIRAIVQRELDRRQERDHQTLAGD